MGVKKRLQNGAAAYVLRTGLGSAAGFVIGDAQLPVAGVALDQIDGAAQVHAIQNHRFPIRTGGIAMRIGSQAESELEMQGKPVGLRGSCLLQPTAQIGAQIFDLTLPDAGNSGREIVFVFRRDAIQHFVGEIQRRRQAGCVHRE